MDWFKGREESVDQYDWHIEWLGDGIVHRHRLSGLQEVHIVRVEVL